MSFDERKQFLLACGFFEGKEDLNVFLLASIVEMLLFCSKAFCLRCFLLDYSLVSFRPMLVSRGVFGFITL